MVSWNTRIWYWVIGPGIGYVIKNPETALIAGYVFGTAWRTIGPGPTLGFVFRFGLVVPVKISTFATRLLWMELSAWFLTTPGGQRAVARAAPYVARGTAAAASARTAAMASLYANPLVWYLAAASTPIVLGTMAHIELETFKFDGGIVDPQTKKIKKDLTWEDIGRGISIGPGTWG